MCRGDHCDIFRPSVLWQPLQPRLNVVHMRRKLEHFIPVRIAAHKYERRFGNADAFGQHCYNSRVGLTFFWRSSDLHQQLTIATTRYFSMCGLGCGFYGQKNAAYVFL